jgi:hypothetical protein
MDIYIMCLLKTSTDDVCLLMAGFNHVENIAKYLPNTEQMPCVSMYNKDGILSTFGAPTGPLSETPQTLLEQFRLARQTHDYD